MNKPKVSIVVPIYGVEKYLHQCVDSILAQTLKDIEIILVDDGSKDKCPEIVDDYAKKDPRVVAVHQPNGGYGRAVNHGIELATGEYIGIIESDDWIEPTMYEKMYNNAKENDTDITKCNFFVYNSYLPPEHQNKVWKHRHQDLFDAPKTVFTIEQYPLLLSFHASIWSNLYRAEFVKGQKVIESRSASYQDFPFMIEAMCRAKRISVVHEALVHYRMEDGQNSSTIRRDDRLVLMAKQSQEAKKILKKYGKYETLKEEFYFHAFLANYGFYMNILSKYKFKYFKELFKLFYELNMDRKFTYKYFTQPQRRITRYWQHGNFWASLLGYKPIRYVRRFFFSIHLSRKGFCYQFMGIQFASEKYSVRPALIRLQNMRFFKKG